MLESSGGTSGMSTSQGIGTLVHALAQQAAEEGVLATRSPSRCKSDSRRAIERVDLGSGWFAGRQRERAAEMVRKLADWMRTNTRAFVAAEQRLRADDRPRGAARGRSTASNATTTAGWWSST